MMPLNPASRFPCCVQGSSKADVYCDSMSTTKGSIPDHPFPYSDHEALTADLRLEAHDPTETRDEESEDEDPAAGILRDEWLGLCCSQLSVHFRDI